MSPSIDAYLYYQISIQDVLEVDLTHTDIYFFSVTDFACSVGAWKMEGDGHLFVFVITHLCAESE